LAVEKLAQRPEEELIEAGRELAPQSVRNAVRPLAIRSAMSIVEAAEELPAIARELRELLGEVKLWVRTKRRKVEKGGERRYG
jgi:hypothetical protein